MTDRSCHVLLVVVAVFLTAAFPVAQEPHYEHRVVVSTTSLDTEAAVEGSLERNVNLLAAAGYEVSAIVGGQSGIVDRLLERKPYAAGLVDHTGQTLVVMARPANGPSRPREYRLIHTRHHAGVSPIVESLGQTGHRLVATAVDGSHFHAAFERADGPSFAYRVYANAGRTNWMSQLEKDAEAMTRLSRVVPMGLDHALVELNPAPASPGALEWFTVSANTFASSDARVRARASAGFRVQTVRVRGNDVDVLLVKPSGPVPPASYDLEDAPWGMPCTRGVIAGADVYTDGDTHCIVDQSATGVINRGFDLRVRAEASAGGRHLLDVPGCEGRAALGSSRVAVRRLLVAAQLERALDARTEAGFRVTRVLAGAAVSGDMRLTVFTTRHPASPGGGASAPGPAPRLAADRDEMLLGTSAALEDQLTAGLAADLGLRDTVLWVEVPAGAARDVRLAGCVQNSREKALAESTLRALLVRTALNRAEVRNDIVIDPWR